MKNLFIFVTIFLACSNNLKKMNNFNESEILNQLDDAGKKNPYFEFPNFEHPYFYPISSRISLFAEKEKRWAIVFEIFGYNNRTNSLMLELIYFGNDLHKLDKFGDKEQFISNVKYIDIINENKLHEIIDSNNFLKPNINEIIINGKDLKIERDLKKYIDKNIPLINKEIDVVSLFRMINEEYPTIMRAKSNQVQECLPDNLTQIMIIDDWHHENFSYYNGELEGHLPSSYETFVQIAKVLTTQNPANYKPSMTPNNNWRNWPNAGKF